MTVYAAPSSAASPASPSLRPVHARLPTVTSPAPAVRTTDHVLLRRAAVERCLEVTANCRSTQTGRLLGTGPAERLASQQRDHPSWQRARDFDRGRQSSQLHRLRPQPNQILSQIRSSRSKFRYRTAVRVKPEASQADDRDVTRVGH